MVKSETIGKLAEALAKAQGQYKPVQKNSINPYFQSKYADLSSIIDAVRDALSQNGLSFIQTNRLAENGKLIVITTLLHQSGEWVEGELAMMPVKADPQAGGSCLTYLRRYSLQQMLGVAAEDEDDGNGASKKTDAPHTPKTTGDKKKTKTTNFKFLEVMEKAKEKLGNDLYYKILGKHGVEHANEITERKAQIACHAEIEKAIKDMKEMESQAQMEADAGASDTETMERGKAEAEAMAEEGRYE